MRHYILYFIVLTGLWAFAPSLFYDNSGKPPEKILTEYFPGSQVKIHNIVLNNEDKLKIKQWSGFDTESSLVSVYLVVKNQNIQAISLADIHHVRTQPEVVLYVFSPDEKIQYVNILTFREPEQYMPSSKWLALLKGKSLNSDPLALRRDIPIISGSTMSAHAVVKHARISAAIVKLYKQKFLKNLADS